MKFNPSPKPNTGIIHPGLSSISVRAVASLLIIAARPVPVRLLLVIAEQGLFVTLPGKRVVELAAPTLRTGPLSSGRMQVFVVLDHLKVVVIPRVVAQTLLALDMEVDAESNAEDDDRPDRGVDPGLGAFRGTEEIGRAHV